MDAVCAQDTRQNPKTTAAIVFTQVTESDIIKGLLISYAKECSTEHSFILLCHTQMDRQPSTARLAPFAPDWGDSYSDVASWVPGTGRRAADRSARITKKPPLGRQIEKLTL